MQEDKSLSKSQAQYKALQSRQAAMHPLNDIFQKLKRMFSEESKSHSEVPDSVSTASSPGSLSFHENVQSPIIQDNFANLASSSLPEIIERMRKEANNSTDQVLQLNFAKYLLEVDSKIEQDPSTLGVGNEKWAKLIRQRLQN